MQQFSVRFDAKGGTWAEAAPEDLTVDTGSRISAPTATPSREHYQFAGWYADLDEDAAFDFENNSVISNLTLYAKWTPNSYTATFNTDGGSTVEAQTVAYTENAKFTKPTDPTKAHYDFGGWYSDEGLKTAYSFNTAVTGNVTLYAKWTAKRYTLTFDSNGGSSVESQTVAYAPDAVFIVPALAPEKADHRFAGWFTDAALTSAYDFSSRVTGSIKLFAKWLYVQVIDQAITYSNGVNARLDDFVSPAQTKKVFTYALSAAKTVRDDAKTQKEIDDAAKALNAAALDLRLEATSNTLEALKDEKTSLKAQAFQDVRNKRQF